MGAVFVQTIVLTRFFGSTVYGQYSFAVAVGTIAMLALSLGLDQVLMRNLARVGWEKAAQSANWVATYLFSIRTTAVISVSVSASAALILYLGGYGGHYALALIVVVGLLPVTILRKFVESLLLGAHFASASLAGTHIVQPLMIILGVGAIYLLGVSPAIGPLLVLYVIAGIISTCCALWLAHKILIKIRPAPGLEVVPIDRGKVLASGGSFAFVTLGFVIGQQIDVLLIGMYGTPAEAGLVRIATRLAELAGVIRAIAILQFKPRIAAAYGREDMAEVQKLASQLALIFLASGIPITLGLLIFAEQAMGVFGTEFIDGAWTMRIYVLGVFFTMICGPCTIIMTLCDQERTASRILWIALAIQFGLDCVLIPFFGPIGCAFANLTSMLFLGVASVLQTRKKLGFNTTILSFLTAKKLGTPNQ